MTFCTAHRHHSRSPMLPSQIAVTDPRRRAPLRPERSRPTFSDWASI